MSRWRWRRTSTGCRPAPIQAATVWLGRALESWRHTADTTNYDEFMPIVGFTPWFPADDSQFNFGPDGAVGTQIFFYRALEPKGYSRHGVGLQHLSFSVPSRAIVHEAHRWAVDHDAEIVHEPRLFPEYGEDCFATFVLDLHGIMLEVVCHAAPVDA